MFRPSRTLQCNPQFSKKCSLKLNEFESVMYNHVYRIQQFQCYVFFRNSKDEEVFYQNYDMPGNKLYLFRLYWHKLKTLNYYSNNRFEFYKKTNLNKYDGISV